MNQQRLNNQHFNMQQQNECLLKEKSLSQFLEEQNLNVAVNESFQMRKAIRTYFDSQPFSTINPEKSKGLQTSCSNSYSGDNSDIITAYSQNNQIYANESDNELEFIEQTQQIHQQTQHSQVGSYQQNNTNLQFVSQSCYQALQKAYNDLQQKYFNGNN